MSKRNKGAMARERKARLAALRAEVVLALENKLLPRHLQYNIQTTQKLLEEFAKHGAVPPWACDYGKVSFQPWNDIADASLDSFLRAVDLTKGT